MKQLATRLAALLVVLVAAMPTSGCLVKETTSTLCLEPDGSVRWSVLQHDIHATGETPAVRQQEEDAFMALARAGRHPAARIFRAYGGRNVTTRIVSDRWPFAVQTEAEFPDIGQLFQDCLRDTRIAVQSTVTQSGGRITWTLDIDASEVDVSSAESDSDTPDLTDLLPDSGPVLFMRHGRFVDATGFDIADDGRVAKCADLSKHDWDKEPRVRLSVTWISEAATEPGSCCFPT